MKTIYTFNSKVLKNSVSAAELAQIPSEWK
jgi:hypothetical protein